MPLLKSYLDGSLSPRDRTVLADILAQGIKTDVALVLDPNATVAKTNGRVSKAVIGGLLERIVLPSMLDAAPKPIRASDLYLETTSKRSPFFLSTGQQLLDQLLGGQGWASGQVSEICGSQGTGKTRLCLNTLVPMLVHNRTSLAIWIDTMDGFSAQGTANIVRAFIKQQEQQHDGGNEQQENDLSIEDQVASVLSRIHVYTCHDVYDLIGTVEQIRTRFDQADESDVARIIILDSLSAVLTGLLRGTDGAGHATMMHAAREFRRLALDFNIVVLATTSTVQLSNPEEQAPSILTASNAKPSLGSSWRYATDLQLYLTKLQQSHHQELGLHHEALLSGAGTKESVIETHWNEGPGRHIWIAEIMKSKWLVWAI
ncbi:P-loop containing nucleoside triphosphate hydrolase protein [Mortierella sp. GBAus27b]|nr:P-loop containing nucleoside triphosphate hydrolase protein [Mortierella sp. GBAus27b]